MSQEASKLKEREERESDEGRKEGTPGNCHSSPDPEMKQNLKGSASSTPNENQETTTLKILTTVFF